MLPDHRLHFEENNQNFICRRRYILCRPFISTVARYSIY